MAVDDGRPPGRVEVIRIGPQDWRVWRALRHAALTDAPTAFGSTLAQWSGDFDTEARWRARLAGSLNLVGHLDGRPVGMVSGMAEPDGTAELVAFWVDPSARGRGVGDALVVAVQQWSLGVGPLWLRVRTANRRAIVAYERCGFRAGGPVAVGPGQPAETLMTWG